MRAEANEVSVKSDAGNHFRNLDSLRGFAALTVVFSHISLISAFIGFRHTPLRVILGGHEAVILFFVLSGFVLSIQLLKQSFKYINFLLRRVSRIYLPYLAVLAMTLMAMRLTSHTPVAWAGEWFSNFWASPLSATAIIQHFILVLPFASAVAIPVIWSLIYEMRISFVFPLLFVLIKKTPTYVSILVAICLSLLSYCFLVKLQQGSIESSINGNWFISLHYAAMFTLGALVADRLEYILDFVRQHKMVNLLQISSVGVYACAAAIAQKIGGTTGDFVFDWLITCSSIGLILCTFIPSHIAKICSLSPCQFLGKISFSIYLVHLPVMICTIHLLGNLLPPIITTAIAFATLMIFAVAFHFSIELPSIKIGRRIAAS